MSLRARRLSVGVLIVTSLAAGAAVTHAQSGGVVFQGLTHAPVGAAALRLDPSRPALDVRGLGASGDDGVAVRAGEATSWTARIEVPTSGVPLRMLWSALADGRRIGSGLLQQSGASLSMSGVFTGATTRPTFSAQVYAGGRLVGAAGGLPPTAQASTLLIDMCRKVPEFCEFTIEFHTLPDGACMIKIVVPIAGPFRLPTGATYTGNELRLVEEVRPASHYPYLGFDAMTIQSDALSFALLSETLR